MALRNGIDVEERIEALVFCALVAGNLSSGDLAEYVHDLRVEV